MATLLDALDAAERDPVFRLAVNAKVPLKDSHGHLDATQDAKQINAWWADGKPYNYGIALRNKVVFDVDVRDGRKGAEWLQLQEMLGTLPPTRTHKSASGGTHLIYTLPPGHQFSNTTLENGVDIKTDGGFIVGPGSTIDGGAYAVIDDREEAELPAYWLDKLPRKHERHEQAHVPLEGIDPDQAQRLAEQYLNAIDPQQFGMYVIVCRVREFGVDEPTAVELIERIVNGEKQGGWPEGYVERTAEHVYRYAQNPQGIANPQTEFTDRSAFAPQTIDLQALAQWKISQWRAAAKDLAAYRERDADGYERLRQAMRQANSIQPDDMDRLCTIAGAHAKTRTKRLYALHFDEIAVPTRPSYLVRSLIDDGGTSVLVADPNAGKSFLALDLNLHIAADRPWFGKKVAQGLAVYLAAEGKISFNKRVAAWRQHHKAENTGLPFALVPCTINLGAKGHDAEALMQLVQQVEDHHKRLCRVLTVDTLNKAFGGGDESSSADMAAYNANIRRLSDELGAHVLSVHHYGKDKTKGGRGHSSLRADVDTEIRLDVEESGERIVRFDKQRDGEAGLAFRFRLPAIPIGVDDEGETITSCVVEPLSGVAPAAEFKPRRLAGVKQGALDSLVGALKAAGAGAVPLADWFKAYSASDAAAGASVEAVRKRFGRSKDTLIDLGLVVVDGDLASLSEM